MSRKTVAFNMAPLKQPATTAADAWIGAAAESAPATPVLHLVPAAEPMKRFTIDVSETLHKRIKAACAMRGTKMADVIRDMLEHEFPKQTS